MGDKLKNLYLNFKNKYENLSDFIVKIYSKMSEKILLTNEEYNDIQLLLIELRKTQDDLFKALSDKIGLVCCLDDIEVIVDQSCFDSVKDKLLSKLELLNSKNMQNHINTFKEKVLNMESSEINFQIIDANDKFLEYVLNNKDLSLVGMHLDNPSLINPELFMGIAIKDITIITKLESNFMCNDKENDLIESTSIELNEDVSVSKEIIIEEDITEEIAVVEDKADDNAIEEDKFFEISIEDKKVKEIAVVEDIVEDIAIIEDKTDEITVNNEVELIQDEQSDIDVRVENIDAVESLDQDKEEPIDIYNISALELLSRNDFEFSSTSIDSYVEIRKEKKNFNKSSFAKSITNALSSSYARVLSKLYTSSCIIESDVTVQNDILALNALFKEGYLAKYKSENNYCIYYLTKIGCEIFTVSQVKSLVKRVTKITIEDNVFNYKDYYCMDKEKLDANYIKYKLVERIMTYTDDISFGFNPYNTVTAKTEKMSIEYIILSSSEFIFGDFEVLKEFKDVDKIVCIVKNENDASKAINCFRDFFNNSIYYALYDELDSFVLEDKKYTLCELFETTDNLNDNTGEVLNEECVDSNSKSENEDVSNIELLEENKQALIESLIIKAPKKIVDKVDVENSFSSQIASYAKYSNDFSLEIMDGLIEKLLEENNLFTALELLNQLSKIDYKYVERYNNLKCALGKTTQSYDSEMLTKYFSSIYDKTTDFNIACFVSTMFRILFSPVNLYDYDFKSWYSQLNNLDTDLQYFNKIKAIASILNDVITKIDKKGFSLSNLKQFKLNEGLNIELDVIIQKAEEIKSYKKNFTFTDKGLFANTLGDKSEIFKCIKWISENDLSKIGDIMNIYERFISNSVINDDLVKNFIKESNQKITNQYSLSATNEKEVIREIKRRLIIIGEWLEFNSNNQIENNDNLKRAKDKLFEAINDYLKEISISSENNIIKYTLKNIIEQFSDEICTHKEIKEFLLSDYLPLNMDLSLYEKELPHYSLFNRLIDHIINNGNIIIDKNSITEKLDYNLNVNENLGLVYSLKTYIESNKLKIDFDFSEIDNYKESYDRQIKDGFQEMINTINLDSMYGRLSEEDSQNLYSEIEVAKDFFTNTFDLGLFKEYKKIVEDYQKELMIVIHNEYCNRLLMLIGDKSLEEYVIINDIFKAIKENNYTVADEYMTLLENGQKDLNKELTTSEDFFGEFNRIYDLLYDLIENRNVKGKKIVGNDYLLSQLTRIAQTELNIQRRRKSTNQAANLLNCWVNSYDQFETKDEMVKKLFEELQFDVDEISNNKKIKEYKCKNVKLHKVGKQLTDYFHPISDFGTNIPDNIPVVFIDGNASAKIINNYITKEFKYDGFTIVLLNGYLSKLERNKLAHEFKTSGSLLHKYIVIDRVLLCFLAMIEKSERQKAFINCSLPYSYVQPFVENGAGRIPDEMFYGRAQELHSIIDIEKGAVLVYGGRQLGKTALLQRVQNLMMKNDEKSYTIYLSIQTIKSSTDLLSYLIKEILLLNKKFNKTIIISDSKASSIKDWSSFGEVIRVSYARGGFNKLYILLDEVDKFIHEQENEGYNVINELIRLKDDSALHGKFKFVLAGLHNVVKYLHKDNDSLRKLGAPLCVKPLSTVDAKRFITEPLSTIGYKFSDEENQISMILSKLNYYPGLLHIFCSRIIKDTNTNFRQYYNNFEKTPPYLIDGKTLGKFLTNNEINTEVNKRLTMTLDLNGSLYLKIACAISYLYEYENKKQGILISDLKQFFNEGTSIDQIKTLLEEMIELGVLRRITIDNNNLYFYRKYSFHKSVLEQKSNGDELLETAINNYDI